MTEVNGHHQHEALPERLAHELGHVAELFVDDYRADHSSASSTTPAAQSPAPTAPTSTPPAADALGTSFLAEPAAAMTPAASPADPVLGAALTAVANADDATVGAADDPTTESYAAQIYDQLKSLFGSTTQTLVMEFPGRVLDPTTYAYPVTGPYSSLVKPQIVTEAEFRLTDAMFDLPGTPDQEGYRAIVNGPSGVQLSIAYQDALSSLVPQITPDELKYSIDKEKLRSWLGELVETGEQTAAGTPALASRMDLYEAKTNAYTLALQAWRKEKEDWFQQALAAPDQQTALDAYARRVAETAESREAGVAALWDDLVVRGYYHEVREALGFLDIATPGEILDQAKAAMRQSGLSSIDETETIYPVQLQPTNWFTDLVSDFSPVDLLLDPDSIRASLESKQDELDRLHQQIAGYLGRQTGDPKALQTQVDSAQSDVDTAMSNLTNDYTQNTITAVKMYLAAGQNSGKPAPTSPPPALYSELDPKKPAAGDAPAPPVPAGKSPISDADWQAISAGLTKVNAAQQTLTEASGKLAQLLAAQASAAVTDAGTTVAALQARVNELTSQIASLNSMLDSAQGQRALAEAGQGVTPSDSPDGQAKLFDKTKTPYAKSLTAGADDKKNYAMTAPSSALLPAQVNGNWETIIVRASGASSFDSSTNHTDSSTTSFDVDLFFGSVSGSSTSSHASDSAGGQQKDWSIAIGMLASKVDIDRGGWFQPGIFANSGKYVHLTDVPFQAGLPGYPTGFLVVKDVTIILSTAVADSSKADTQADSARSTSGGVLCFSVASSSSSHDESHQTASTSVDSSVVIRIPQPQILGWFTEATAQDSSAAYNGLPAQYPPAAAVTPTV